MASTKLKDLAVKVGSYTDRSSGQEKGRYENVGAIMQSDDGNMFVMLKRTFNPAGVPGNGDRDSLLISAFDPQPRDGQDNKQRGNRYTGGGYDQSPDRGRTGGALAGGDNGGDSIPFMMEWR